jgi:hypothetical protein
MIERRNKLQAGGRTAGFIFSGLFARARSSRIHAIKPGEPWITRNIAYHLSLSTRAMQTGEEKFND